MMTLADATGQLTDLTQKLSTNPNGPSPTDGAGLIDRWTGSLEEVEMTQPLAETLGTLKQQLTATNTPALQKTLKTLAEQIAEMSAKMGAEGEMPGLLEGLAAALRQLADVSRTDTVA